MRILCMSDSPFIPTGQARVGREIAVGIAKHGHDVGYLGWWHRNDIMPNLPYNIQFWWTNNAEYGADVFDSVVNKFQPEIVITIGDFWNLWYMNDPNVCRTRRSFQWISYIPVDGEPIGGGIPPDVVPIIEEIDVPIAYTEYAKNAVLKSVEDQETRNRIKVIYHGVDTQVFKPLEPSERRNMREQFGFNDKFIFLVVCRNQTRKNIPEMLRAWKIFSETPEAKNKVVLWLHTYFKDSAGWDIDNLLTVNGLKNNSVIFYDQIAHGKSAYHLLPENELAKLYQISDAFMLISGEGFGIPTFEAMATRLPCLLLDYASSAEIGADGRAHLVPWTCSWTGLHLTQRPVPDPHHIYEGLLKIYRDKRYRDNIAMKGYEYVQNYTWQKIADEWNSLILQMEIPFMKPLRLEVIA